MRQSVQDPASYESVASLTGVILDTDHVLEALSLVNAACYVAEAPSVSFGHRVGVIVPAASNAHALLLLRVSKTSVNDLGFHRTRQNNRGHSIPKTI